MIESIHIKNYKSILDLSFDVGRVNVLIGENGCGKSNILEALTVAGAAEANKLDNEFLTSRGIRLTPPVLMRSCFNKDNNSPIEVAIKLLSQDKIQTYTLRHDNKPYSSWEYISPMRKEFMKRVLKPRALSKEAKPEKSSHEREPIADRIDDLFSKQVEALSKTLSSLNYWESSDLIDALSEALKFPRLLEGMIIYSPEETALRNFHQEDQVEPLGIHGEGLFKLLKVLSSENSAKIPKVIKQSLHLLDWFEDIDILDSTIDILEEPKISLIDRFIQSKFDQQSVNEGFLFILFYSALMISEDTPKIFAIDNVDASLNPKLCTKIMADIAQLAKKFDKQCFLTTHNPAILDGLDLGDDEQRLFVVSRNRKGHTQIKRITVESKPVSSTGEELKLSEALLRGYLGGLPKNF